MVDKVVKSVFSRWVIPMDILIVLILKFISLYLKY